MTYLTKWLGATLAIGTAFLILATGIASALNDPIPGIDIVVRKHPGGIVATTKTGKDGRYVIENLAPGKYLLEVHVPKTRTTVNTSTANIRHPSAIVRNGVEEHEVFIEFGTGRDTRPYGPVEVEITAKRGKISGTITHQVAPKKTEKK